LLDENENKQDLAQRDSLVVTRGKGELLPSWEPPRELPELPTESVLRRAFAQALFQTGGIRAAERVARWWQGRFRKAGDKRTGSVFSPKSAILCYHRIGTRGVPLYSGLPRSVFEQQIAYLRKHYRIISLEELLTERESAKNNVPGVVITFDDGYADLYSEAFPVLRQYEVPATIYLVAGAIQSGEIPWYDRIFVAFQVAPADKLMQELGLPDAIRLETPKQRLVAAARYIFTLRTLRDAERRERCDSLQRRFPLPLDPIMNRMLTWSQIREMQSAGISFGSHTMSHPMLSKLNSRELLYELRDSRNVIENELQRPVPDFSYPFGTWDSFNGETCAQLAALHYRSAVSSIPGLNTEETSPLALRRVTYCETSSLAIFAARLGRLFLSLAHDTGAVQASRTSDS